MSCWEYFRWSMEMDSHWRYWDVLDHQLIGLDAVLKDHEVHR